MSCVVSCNEGRQGRGKRTLRRRAQAGQPGQRTLAGGQPGPTRAAPPAAFGVAAHGGGSCGDCGSGGRPQRGANQPDGADDRGQVRACDMRATCLHSVLRSDRGGKGQGGEGGAGRT